MEGTLTCTMGSHPQHAHSLEDHTLSIQQSTSTHTKHNHNIQQQNSNHTKTYCELFHKTIHKHCQTHKTNIYTNRETHKIQGYNITLTTSQVQEAIKQSKNKKSQRPDKLNIRHLKHIGPLGLAFLTSMFKTALNKNIIPHTWKLANIVHIPKPNKDTDKGTSYRPISLLSVITKTLKKSLLLYITANIPNTPTQHGYKTQHSTVTALHTANNTVAKGFNQMAPPARTITVALDMSKAFDTINIHTPIRKLLQLKIPGIIIKFIENYIKGRKTYTTEITQPHNVNSKLAFNKVASFHQHYSTFTLQTYHHQEHQFRSWHTQLTSPLHLHTQARVQPRNTYNHTYIKFLPGQNKTISH